MPRGRPETVEELRERVYRLEAWLKFCRRQSARTERALEKARAKLVKKEQEGK